MVVAEVSTRSIAEVDLEPQIARRFATYFYGGGELTEVLFTDSEFPNVVPPSTHDIVIRQASDIAEIVRSRQEKDELLGPVVGRVAFSAIEPLVRHVTQARESSNPTNASNLAIHYKAITNWLRSAAEDEQSRPILDLEEITPPLPRTRVPISVSASLKTKPPTTNLGLGHVSAGLLLWLESSEADDRTPNEQ